MKKTSLFLPLLFLLGSYAPGAAAQEEEALIVLVSRDKCSTAVMDMYAKTQSSYLHEARAPRFLLLDRKHQYALGIGGYVSFRTAYDFNGAVANTDFVPADIPVPNNSARNGHFFMDGSTSRLFLKLVGKNRLLGDFTAYIETDFRGADYTLHLRQAYVAFRGFTLGQTWSTFSDVEALPPTVDFEGPCGNTANRTLQVRYTCNVLKNWEFAVAAEAPSLSATYDDESQKTYQRMPDIPVYAQYSWGKSHIRATAVFRGLSYHDNLSDRNDMEFGWGTQLSGKVNILPRTKLYFQATYGEGIANYIGDPSYIGGLDLVPDYRRPGKMQDAGAYGIYGGLQFNLTRKCYVSGTYSQVRLYSKHGNFSGDDYRYGQYVVGNLFYNLTPNCLIGGEYLYGRRVNFDGRNGHANRIQALVQYNF